MRLYIICLTISLLGCERIDYDSTSDVDSSDEEPDYIPHVETTLDFRGTIRKLFAVEVGLASRGQNMICSPISAMMPLAKLLLGAKKKSTSEKELLAALGLKHKYEMKSTFKQALKEIKYLQGVQIIFARRIYVSRKYRLVPKFKKKSHSIFGSAVELIDVTNPDKVADTVNNWVYTTTNRMIKMLISRNDVPPNLSLLLVNAIYFKGSWKVPFHQATLSLFHSPSGIIHALMMSITGKFNYFQSDDLNAQVIELPYKGEQSAMIIVLPNAKNGLPILLRTLKVSTDLLNTALRKMKTTTVEVTIPKFKIETTIDLRNYYSKVGVSASLREERSGLKEIVKGQTVFISNAVQKAIIEVTETGTAAAAASAGMITVAGTLTPRPRFIGDHPFLFYVRGMHEQLFSGIVISPVIS